MLTIVLGVMGLLSVFNKQYVEPYETFGGQLALTIVALLFLGGLMWLRRLATPERTDRFLIREAVTPVPISQVGEPA